MTSVPRHLARSQPLAAQIATPKALIGSIRLVKYSMVFSSVKLKVTAVSIFACAVLQKAVDTTNQPLQQVTAQSNGVPTNGASPLSNGSSTVNGTGESHVLANSNGASHNGAGVQQWSSPAQAKSS